MNISDKQKVVARIVAIEQGYVNNPLDRGGPTNWGYTEKNARKKGYTGDMKNLPKASAEAWYITDYIEAPGFDAVYDVDATIGFELIDTGVNMGQSTAGKFFQRWLNALNLNGKIYPDMVVDGQVGPKTIGCFQKFVAYRGQTGRLRLLKALNAIQGNRYLEIAEATPTQEAFVLGWLDRV